MKTEKDGKCFQSTCWKETALPEIVGAVYKIQKKIKQIQTKIRKPCAQDLPVFSEPSASRR